MSTQRERWLATVAKFQLDPDEPAGETSWSPDLETCSPDRTREIQSEKLASAFAYLHEASPYFHERFGAAGLSPGDVRSVEDLHKVPITTKDDWIGDQAANPPWGTVSPLTEDRWNHAGWMMFTTPGSSTGLPRTFRHTRHDQAVWSWLGARALWSMGVRPGDIAMNCFGYGPFVAFWCLHYALHKIGCPVIPGGGMNTERRAFFIDTYRPTVLITTPSYALRLGRAMRDLDFDPATSSVTRIITAAEPGPGVPATKERIEKLWGAKLHDNFGCSAVAMTPLGYTCEAEVEHTDRPVNVHLMEDAYIAEVVHPETHEPVEDGTEGVLVVSNLYSESTPILRYLMGDWATMVRRKCECGRTHVQAAGGLHGRSDSMLKIRGVAFFPSTLEDGIHRHPDLGDEFRVEISTENELDHVKIVVEPASAIPKDSYTEPRERLRRQLKGSLGVDVEVELVPYGTLSRETARADRIQDLRKNAGGH